MIIVPEATIECLILLTTNNKVKKLVSKNRIKSSIRYKLEKELSNSLLESMCEIPYKETNIEFDNKDVIYGIHKT